MMKIDFYRHGLAREDASLVAEVLASRFLTTGPVAKEVEEQLSAYFDVPHAVLVNSWTNGAFAALLALDLQPGDEVIVPAMTFVATANVVVLAGGSPVFVDADPGTLLLTPEAVASAITENTRAVIPVHLYGQMCDIASMRRAIDARTGSKRHIVIIEDCAHCFEGKLNGEKPGRHSDAAIFSFYATKNVTCGEGGAIITRDPDLYERTLEARLHGMSAIAVNRFAGGRYNHWDMTRIGTKANLPDILAVLLPRQIATIDARLPDRRAIAAKYRQAFLGGPLRLVEQMPNCVSADHLFAVGIPHGKRDAAIASLNQAGISVTVNFRSVPDLTFYRNYTPLAGDCCPVARRWGEETLTLPLFPTLAKAEQEYIIKTVESVIYPMTAK
jgi:UDP-4-amino-4-deoxy-L-arabinose-oxoglutarate aminotransferase